MIIDIIKFTVKDEHVETAIRHMEEQTRQNRGDEGCEMSHVFRSKENPTELFMLLSWANQESVDKHLETAHDREFISKMDSVIAGPPDFFEKLI